MLLPASPADPKPGWPDIYQALKCDIDDSDAWFWIQRHICAWVWYIGWPILRRAQDDIVSETCKRVVEGFDGARGPTTFGAFVHGHYLNALKTVRLTLLPWQEVPLGDFDVAAPVPEIPDDEMVRVLHACLRRLPEHERRAIELKYFEDADSMTIAQALRVRAANARQILRRARVHLHRLVDDWLQGQQGGSM